MRMSALLTSFLCLCLLQDAASQGTSLGGGIVTRTNVDYLADLSLDVKDMAQSFGNTNVVLDIYQNGRNSMKPSGLRFKLEELETDMSYKGVTGSTPIYLFQLYGLAQLSTDIQMLASHFTDGKTEVSLAISGAKDYAPTAALIFNVWMYATHVLYAGVSTCSKMVQADNSAQFDLAGGGMDEFIALWVGKGQTPGSKEGYSLYALAETASALFFKTPEKNDILLESKVNKDIKLLYHEGSGYLSGTGACSKDVEDTPELLWSVVNRIVSKMYIPLIQLLIDAIIRKDEAMTSMYAMVVVPQASQCRISSYNRLREYLLLGSPKFDKTEVILRDLQDIYSCFALTCEDIGDYLFTPIGLTLPQCTSAKGDAALAGYQPTTNVLSIAKLDLDVKHMEIFSSVGNFEFARFWFLYGRNSPVQRDSENDLYSFYSINQIGSSASRGNAGQMYLQYTEYFNNLKYGAVIVLDALEGKGKWGNKSNEQRAAVISETSAFLILYLHLIAQIKGAVNHCRGLLDMDGDYDVTHPWDEVAALLIGSLEGTEIGGATDGRDGQLLWSLSTKRAFQFQTLNSEGYAKTNSKLSDALYAGRGEIDALDCDRLDDTADKIQSLSYVSLLQSIVRYAILNEAIQADSTKADLAYGETYALAIIPLIEEINPEAASILKDNMIQNDNVQPVRDGAQIVADAVGSAAVSLGLHCHDLGSTSQANPCRNYGSSAESHGRLFLFSIAAAMTTIFISL